MLGGFCNPTFNVVASYLGGGLVLHNFFGPAGADAVGLAIAHADLSRDINVESGAVAGADTTGSGTEITFEATYQRRLRTDAIVRNAAYDAVSLMVLLKRSWCDSRKAQVNAPHQ